MKDKTEQSMEDTLRLAARNAALAGINGWGNLCSDAADAIDNLRAQLAEAQRDSERLDWMIEQALTDALIDQIESAAWVSFRRHQSSIKGQILTAADNYDWHLLHAAYQAGIHALRAQLAEAQKDAERWRRAAQCVRLDQFGGFVVTPDEPAFASEVSLAFIREIDAAIGAAKGKTS